MDQQKQEILEALSFQVDNQLENDDDDDAPKIGSLEGYIEDSKLAKHKQQTSRDERQQKMQSMARKLLMDQLRSDVERKINELVRSKSRSKECLEDKFNVVSQMFERAMEEEIAAEEKRKKKGE